MVWALIVFFFRVCYAVFENDRSGPYGMKGMFGKRTEYLDGSIGIEVELDAGIYCKNLKSGVAYATASIDVRPIWMIQVDNTNKIGGRLELVSHVMDAGDTSTLLILEHSMNLLLKQFVTAIQPTPLKTIVDNFNKAVKQMNTDPDWKIKKMPLLELTDAAPVGISVKFFGWDWPPADLAVQVNFGVPVETFTPSRINEFLRRHRIPAVGEDFIKYLTKAVYIADKWASTFFALSNLRFTSEEQGILALTIAKTLGKQVFFGPLAYNDIAQEVNHIRAMKGQAHTEYKNSWIILPKMNVRELISAAPTGALHFLLHLLSSEDFLQGRGEWAEEQAVADIQRLVDRGTLAVTAPVDDDCFVDADRVFSPQRHSDGRLAIVMETRFSQPHSVWMRAGFLMETRSTVEAVKRYQALYGDLMGIRDLRAFLDFEVAVATTKLPEYQRVTLGFDALDIGVIQDYVLPLAKDTQFLRSLRRIGNIRKIIFMNYIPISSANRAPIVAAPRGGLLINIDSIKAGTWTPMHLRQALISYIDTNSRRILKDKFTRIKNIARKFNVRQTGEENLVDFNTVERFRSHFAAEIHKRLLQQRIVIGAADSLTVLVKWAAFHGEKRPQYVWSSINIPCLVNDLKHTLEMWIDMDLNGASVSFGRYPTS